MKNRSQKIAELQKELLTWFCRRTVFSVNSNVEDLVDFLPLYPQNGSLQFVDDFRSPFVDKADCRQSFDERN